MAIPNIKTRAGKLLRGRTSWYGGPNDAMDNNIPALPGATNKNPGIAVYNRDTLGGWWRLRDPRTGKVVIVQQTDLGPNTWTGKKIDLNARLIRDLGYSESNYPNHTMGARYLGKRRPAGAGDVKTAAAKKTSSRRARSSSSSSSAVDPARRAAILSALLNADPADAASGRLRGLFG